MIDKREYEFENDRLAQSVDLLNKELSLNDFRFKNAQKGVNDLLSYISSHFQSMDPEERASMKLVMEDGDYQIVELVTREAVLRRQLSSPYFGRIDFRADDENFATPYYVGISNLFSKDGKTPFICDWRAPVSSMYYDFETGRAEYLAPAGSIRGDISLKRQYSIKDQKLKFMFDSSLTIGDEILQETLSQTTDAKMKNIVSTIQKEQNKIIRSEIYRTLVVQGVAGCGKTSIALHRVAFLLYRHKDKIKSRDIMIISPNKIFSDYISNVLPELGEQNICETTIGEIARDELKDIAKVEDRSEMLDDIIDGNTTRKQEVSKKGEFAFYEALKNFLYQDLEASFVPSDIVVGEAKVSKEQISDLFFQRYKSKDFSTRIEYIADFATDEIAFQNEGKGGVFSRIKARLLKMFSSLDIVQIYSDFLSKQGMRFSLNDEGEIRFEDVPGILFVKDFLIGIEKDKTVKYLLIDEMQDYSPIHFAIFNKKFECPKTVLGDIYQCVEKEFEKDYLEKLANMFDDSILLDMKKSYRSTVEIASFAQNIIGLCGAQNVDRHGEKPDIVKVTKDKEYDMVLEELRKLGQKGYSRIGVVCKTDDEAKNVFEFLDNKVKCSLLTNQNSQIEFGNIVASSALSKGLEFDGVIIPFASKANYSSETDRRILYISSTRALHSLVLIHSGEPSPLFKGDLLL